MEYRYFVAAPGLVGVATTARAMDWSWGANMPPASAAAYAACRFKLRFTLRSRGVVPDRVGRLSAVHYHDFVGVPGAGEVSFDRKISPLARLQLRLTGLLDEEIHLEANLAYARLVKYRVMNLHSVGYILTDLLAWRLLHEGFVPLYAAAFTLGGSTVLAMGPSRTGKSLLATRAHYERGARFLSEDIAILDGARIHAVPFTNSYHAERGRCRTTGVTVPYAGDDGPVAVDHVAFLERSGPEEVRALSAAEAVTRALSLNHFVFRHMNSPLLLAYAYLNPDTDAVDHAGTERAALEILMAGAKNRWLLRSADPARYLDMFPGPAEVTS